MAKGSNSSAAIAFTTLPIQRQLGLLIGLAAAIALGIGVAFWSMEPNYQVLFSHLSPKAKGEVVAALQQANIDYKIDNASGAVLVDSAKIHEARIKLATDDIEVGIGSNFDFLNKTSGLTSSQFMETARYRHALERELASTISNFRNVKAARVHLAIPKQTAFLRSERQPTASVFLDIYAGKRLSDTQVASIANLVASSVPNLNNDRVTVVDEQGRLLTDSSGDDQMGTANRMLGYKNQVEELYENKIDSIITPILGIGSVKAKVSADIDFTASEHTSEVYNPDLAALRSEQVLSEQRGAGQATAGGIPGALSNQPPVADGEATTDTANKPQKPESFRNQATKNYELDKTISHVANHAGRIKRLTVAVLVDDRTEVADDGKVTKTKLTDEEIKKLETLVKNSIGYNEKRGDSVTVVNTSFLKPEKVEALPEPAIWQQDWFISVAKQTAAGLFIIILLFGFVRPILKGLATQPIPNLALANGASGAASAGQQQASGEMQKLPQGEDRMKVVQSMATAEPQKVAQVVKTWVDG